MTRLVSAPMYLGISNRLRPVILRHPTCLRCTDKNFATCTRVVADTSIWSARIGSPRRSPSPLFPHMHGGVQGTPGLCRDDDPELACAHHKPPERGVAAGAISAHTQLPGPELLPLWLTRRKDGNAGLYPILVDPRIAFGDHMGVGNRAGPLRVSSTCLLLWSPEDSSQMSPEPLSSCGSSAAHRSGGFTIRRS